MSGCAVSSQARTLVSRALIELTFQVATLTTFRRLGRSGDREGVAAAAGRGGVRVLDLEGGAHHVLDEIDLGAVEEVERGVVDDDLHAVALEHDIAVLARVVEAEAVLEAGAAAAGHGDAQEGAGGIFLGLEKGNAPRRALADANAALDGGAALSHGKLLKIQSNTVSRCRQGRRIVKSRSTVRASGRARRSAEPARHCRDGVAVEPAPHATTDTPSAVPLARGRSGRSRAAGDRRCRARP